MTGFEYVKRYGRICIYSPEGEKIAEVYGKDPEKKAKFMCTALNARAKYLQTSGKILDI